MDTSRLRFGEMIAAVSGVVLFIVMFFSWYGVELGGAAGKLANQFVKSSGVDTTATAWQAFGFIDILLFVAVLVAVGLAIMTMTQRTVALPVAASVLTTGVGALAVLLILFRILDKPDAGAGDLVNVTLKFGIFLGLLAAIGITVGGYLSMQEEGTSLGEAARDLQAGGSGSPGPGTGPGAGPGAGAPPAQPAPPPAAPPAGGTTPPAGGPPPSSPPPGG
jgi:hypothetical protein